MQRPSIRFGWRALGLGLTLLSALSSALLGGCEAVVTPAAGTPSAPARPAASATRPATAAPSPTPQPTSAVQIAPDALRGVTLQVWHPWDGKLAARFEELAAEFSASNSWGVAVTPQAIGSYDDLDARLRAAELADLPDVAIAYRHQALNWPADRAPQNIAPYVADPEWGLAPADQADFFPVMWDFDVSDGVRLGVPALRSAQMLFYNRSWAQELGFASPPQTAAEFQTQACAAAAAARADDDPDNNRSGGWLIATDPAGTLGWLRAFGLDLSAGPTPYPFSQPPAETAFTFLRDLLDRGCAWQSDSLAPDTEFAARRALFVTGSLTAIPAQQVALNRLNSGDAWAAIPFPGPDGGGAFVTYGPSHLVLTSDPARQLAAWLWLRWLLDAAPGARLTEAAGGLPLRQAQIPLLDDYRRAFPAWEAALQALPLAAAEPNLASWQVVRWALHDAATQLFRYYFTIDQTPSLVRLLEATANDLHAPGMFPSPTPALTPEATP
jgi:ABC-type glycerol-3-phosphate transport system substrate-binding protein